MKIFGIGLARTGTLSLCDALGELGYRTIHCPWSVKEIEEYDAAVDTTVTLGYKFLDVMYPGSKFIYTKRGLFDWLNSCEKFWRIFHINQSPEVSKLHKALYGSCDFNRNKFCDAYTNHMIDVGTHFLGRGDDFLEFSVCNADGWEPLCKFLNKPIPDKPFPHLHSLENIVSNDDKPTDSQGS